MTDCEIKKAAYEQGRHDALEEMKDKVNECVMPDWCKCLVEMCIREVEK